MKHHLIFLFLLNIIGFGAIAQPSFEWVNQIGGTGSERGGDIVVDNAGNVYTTGWFRNTVDFDPGPGIYNLSSVGFSDGFITKVNANGDLVWAHRFGASRNDYGISIALDALNNVYVSGRFENTVDFDPGTGTANLSSAGLADAFVVKFNTNGNFIWARHFEGTDTQESQGLTCDAFGNVTIVGEFNSTIDCDPGPGVHNISPTSSNHDGFVIRLNSSGNFVWANSYGQDGHDIFHSVDLDASGNVYVTGKSSAGTSSEDNIIIAKYNSSGTQVWTREIGANSTYDEAAWSIAVDDVGNSYITGSFRGTLDFDPGPGIFNLTSNSITNVYVLKLNSAGNFSWAGVLQSSATTYHSEIALSPNGDILITGGTDGTTDFDPGVGSTPLTSTGSQDIFVVQLSSMGAFQWAILYGGTGTDLGKSVAVDNTGSVYITGEFSSTADFDPESGTSNLTSLGSRDVFIQKLDLCIPTAPTPNNSSLSDLTNECLVSAPATPTATNCLGTFNGTADVTFPITAQGTTVVTWTYDDGSGNTSTQTQNVIINDTTVPTPDVATLSDVNSTCEVTSLTPPSATDNCASSVTVTHNASLPITAQGTTMITWTYDDGNGNTSTQTQNVIINDATAPTPDTPSLSDINSTCQVTSLTPPTATDNCASSVTVTHNASLPITTQGTSVVTWTYDDGNGNTTTQTQNVIVNDASAPTPDLATLSDINDACQVTNLTPPTATDNCASTVVVTHDATLPITSQGTTVVTWTYDDGNGNTTTQAQNVIINDATAPNPDVATLSDINTDCQVTSLTPPTATDNCASTVNVTHNASLPISTQGTTVVTWTYDDGNGNTVTQTQNVIINDAIDPTPDAANLSDVNAECEVTNLSAPTATDNCANTVNVTHNASLPITTQGTTVVTWTYDDGNGNTTTQTQNVIINDATAPAPDLANLPDINAECEVASLTPPTASDNCASSITVTHDASLPITTQGTTVVTWTYDDGNGNTTTQTQNVILSPIDVSTSTTLTGNIYELSANASGYNYQWLSDCGGNNIQLGGETNQTFTPVANGSYAVIVDNGTCSDTSDCIVIDNVSVETIDFGNNFKVYPNPTTEEVNIDLGILHQLVTVTCYNALGQKVISMEYFNAEGIQFILDGAPGMYLLEVSSGSQTARMNLIKN